MDLWLLANDESCLRHQPSGIAGRGRLLKGNKVTTSL